MEGKISMSARRQFTNKLRDSYRKASKKDQGLILDQVISTTGLARSTVRRLLTGPRSPLLEGATGSDGDQRRLDDETRPAAAELGHDPPGRPPTRHDIINPAGQRTRNHEITANLYTLKPREAPTLFRAHSQMRHLVQADARQ